MISSIEMDDLVRKAEPKITGANAHEVRGLLTRIYRSQQYILKNEDKTDKKTAEWVKESEKWVLRDVKYLEHFLKTGEVPSNHNNYCGLNS